MEKDEQFIDFYTGSEIMIMGLRKRLEAVGVFGMMQNDFNSGNLAGFVGGSPNTVRFKIRAKDVEKAQPILEEYLNLEDNE
ncbi:MULTISPECIES: DUF2007 domain-containing protein [Flavobacteriaceae]|uniref:DUF2007 domain-containing protein n=2 Tax=Flavobacteriaceae TaxID=49546 RepID=A0A4Y8ASY9_9FLAO|nr:MULTISPECIES: DUF2007 domain-containing protein [Flavobacteriaceae]TEW73909.1 DUF2007 domain-containing protein [Gramella jeungdoensis]GGK38629.1 hypothetical protein GCM10007963_03420 [Lutibacter litoralis]